MSWVAAAIGGSALVGAYVTDQGTKRAVNAQNQATAAANETQRYMYDQTREDQQPWRQVGVNALADLENPDFQRDFTMSDFQADPGYQFRMNEAMKAIQGSAAAKGNLNSGATLKAITRFGQDYASNEFGNARNRFIEDRDKRFNRLATLAGIGQTATGQTANAGANYANQTSQNLTNMGNAIGAANIAQSNNMTNLIGQGMTAGALYYGRGK